MAPSRSQRTTASIRAALAIRAAARVGAFSFLHSRSSTMDDQHTQAGKLSRRSMIKGAAALGAAGAVGALTPMRARAQGTALETKAAKLGFIALTDAAPLFVADEKGFFKKHGMTEV